MRRLVLGAALAVTACGFDWDAFDPRKGTDGTGGSGGSTGGSGGAAMGGTGGSGGMGGQGGECSEDGGAPGTVFTMVEQIPELTSAGHDDDPMSSDDRHELFFSSNRDATPFQTFRSTRDCATDPWSEPEEVTELSMALESTSPMLAPDGLTMFLSYEDPLTLFDIHITKRNGVGETWATPSPVTELNSIDIDRVDWISADERRLVMDSQRTGGGDLFTSTRPTETSAWTVPPQPITELNTTDHIEFEAWLSPDELTIYYTSTEIGTGDGNIVRATRDSDSDPWDPPQPVAELNTNADESDPWVSPDGRHVLFTRTVNGLDRLFRASR